MASRAFTQRWFLLLVILVTAGTSAQAQHVVFYPAADSIGLWGTCTPPGFVCALTDSAEGRDRILISPYWAVGFFLGFQSPSSPGDRLDSVYWDILDTPGQNRYELWYTHFSPDYPAHCVIPMDSVVFALEGRFDLLLLVYRDSVLMDSSRARFVAYQTGLSVDAELPSLSGSRLLPPFPNPFNAGAVIQYTLEKGGDVAIEAYDLLGRLVETIVRAREEEGSHSVQWEPQSLPSGTYLIVLRTESGSSAARCALVR